MWNSQLEWRGRRQKETEGEDRRRMEKRIRCRWLVMQVMDGVAGHPQLCRVMIFGPVSI